MRTTTHQGRPTEPSEVKILGQSERVVCWTKAGCLQVYQGPGWQPLLDLESPLVNTDQQVEWSTLIGPDNYRYCPLIGPDPSDTVLSLVEPY